LITTTQVRLLAIIPLLFAGPVVLHDSGLAQFDSGRALTTEQWLEDLDFVVTQLKSYHPNLYYRISEEDFDARVAQSRAAIRNARSDLEAYLAIRRTIAGVQDGHTQLLEEGAFGITDLRFPFRLDRFRDGVFITVIADEHQSVLGARVVAVNGTPIEEAVAIAERAVNMDNEFGRVRPALAGFTFARIVYGLGLAEDVESIVLDVIPVDGEPTTVTFESIVDTRPILWSNRVNIGPTEGEYVHPAATLGKNTPLHLRRQGPDVALYWFEHLPEEKALFFQLNGVVANQPGSDETFAEFSDRLWSYVDEHADEVDKLVIDLRYNDGGNARRIIPFVNEIIKRDFLNRRGSLFVLVGKRTYSAAVIFLTELVVHTDVIVLGNPPGCPFNFFSDWVSRGYLPNSNFELMVASRQIDNAWSYDTVYFPPDIPASFSSQDYFGGRDPALEIALHGDTRTITDFAADEGAEAALADFLRQRQEYADRKWWRGWDAEGLERQINQRGYALMGDGRMTSAYEVFKLNTLLFPTSSNVWDSLGELYYNTREYELALESYGKSVELDPGNQNGRRWIDRIIREIGQH
jgi:tetratricopeptide (TPR) repeat protein